jgi:hypothetical protein
MTAYSTTPCDPGALQIAATDVLTEAWTILNQRAHSDLLGAVREALFFKHQVPHFNYLGVRLPQGPGFLIVNLGGSMNKWHHKVRMCNKASVRSRHTLGVL